MTRSSEFLNCEPTVYKLGTFHVVDYCGHDGICVGHAYHVRGTAKDAITMMRRINNEFHYSDSSVRSCLALLTGSIKYVSADEVCGKLIVKENSNGSSTINQEMNNNLSDISMIKSSIKQKIEVVKSSGSLANSSDSSGSSGSKSASSISTTSSQSTTGLSTISSQSTTTSVSTTSTTSTVSSIDSSSGTTSSTPSSTISYTSISTPSYTPSESVIQDSSPSHLQSMKENPSKPDYYEITTSTKVVMDKDPSMNQINTNKTEEEYQQTYSYNDSFDFNAYFGSSSEQSYHEEMQQQQQQYTTTEPYVPYRKRRHDELHHLPEKKVTWDEIRRRSYTCFFLTNILFNVVHPHSLTIVDTSLKLELDIPYQSS